MNRFLPAFFAALCVAGALPRSSDARQPCVPRISDEFADGWISGRIHALLVHQTPSGPELFAGGNSINSPLDSEFTSIVRWDGHRWTPILTDVDYVSSQSFTYALTMFDDGTGPALYAGRYALVGNAFGGVVVRWDGASWSQVGGVFDNSVLALKVFDDGSGGALYAAGRFTTSAGASVPGVARLSAGSWVGLASGISGGAGSSGNQLESFDDGRGPALYVGGSFSSAGGVAASNIARWDGHAWSALGAGTSDAVTALATIDLGQGPALYVGGAFQSAGSGVPGTRNIARWDGSSWSALGAGTPAPVNAIAPFDDGAGSQLYAATQTNVSYRWDGAQWTQARVGMGNYYGPSHALALYPTDHGPMLVVGGSFDTLDWGHGFLSHRERGSQSWQTGMTDASVSIGTVRALTTFDDGTGLALYAAGNFEGAGAVYSPALAKYTPTGWASTGLPPQFTAEQVAAYTGPRDSALAIFGYEPSPYGGLAVWSNGAWEFEPTTFRGPLGVVPSGPLGGLYTIGPGNTLMCWKEGGWVAISSPVYSVAVLTSLDEGSGPELCALGTFTSIGGVPAAGAATWNGERWNALAHGTVDSGGPTSATTFDDGTGPALYVAGTFTSIGGVPAPGMARYRNGVWTAVARPLGGTVNALQAFDDGSGMALYAAGDPGLTRWNGHAWSFVGGQVSGTPTSLTVYDDGTGPALWTGGDFESIGSVPTGRIAKWIGCRGNVCYANCDGSTGSGGEPTLNVSDFICFQQQFSAGAPYANCDGSTDARGAPTLNVNDFMCFLHRFAEGCH